ncbi:hypothetical protein [Ensifer sp. YR511]|uniref:hypothetical protein n=1 Tax=Ensifer sp. YR511 TaxID=1855294 RepID=UPI00088EDCD7|nr:hypothetical protein [Ensifer sp. YR511]SDM28539.1 hypothetical protein SAMN05216328_107280 [Ensifer sp. YR511]
MTLVLSVQTKGSIWMVADRRLTINNKVMKEDARKIVKLRTTDGVAMIGYAGLGATRSGTEPSTWIANVLRGRNLLLQPALNILADALKREFPPQLRGIEDFAHVMVVPAIVEGRQRLYSIDLVKQTGRTFYRYSRHITREPMTSRSPTYAIFIAGSGAHLLMRKESWKRPLLRLVKAYNKGRVCPKVIADHLAAICYGVHKGMMQKGDRTVGPKSIVAWSDASLGGGQLTYNGEQEEASASTVPVIDKGMDVQAVGTALMQPLMEHAMGMMRALEQGVPIEQIQPPSEAALKGALDKLPSEPDEKLR